VFRGSDFRLLVKTLMFKILEKNLFNQLARTVDIWNLPIINYDLYMKGVVTIKKYIKLHIVRRFCIILLLICEFNKFNKILVAFGDEEEPLIHDPYRLPLSVKLNKNADRRIQKRAMKVLSQYYVLGWLPGMLVSRFVVMRGVRLMDKSRNKKIHYLVKKYKTVFRRLHHLPDLLVLNTMYGRGYIAAKEAVKLNVPTIAINNSNAFPSKVFTRLFGNDRHMMSIYFFVLMIQEIMDCGHELNKNFLTIKKKKK